MNKEKVLAVSSTVFILVPWVAILAISIISSPFSRQGERVAPVVFGVATIVLILLGLAAGALALREKKITPILSIPIVFALPYSYMFLKELGNLNGQVAQEGVSLIGLIFGFVFPALSVSILLPTFGYGPNLRSLVRVVATPVVIAVIILLLPLLERDLVWITVFSIVGMALYTSVLAYIKISKREESPGQNCLAFLVAPLLYFSLFAVVVIYAMSGPKNTYTGCTAGSISPYGTIESQFTFPIYVAAVLAISLIILMLVSYLRTPRGTRPALWTLIPVGILVVGCVAIASLDLAGPEIFLPQQGAGGVPAIGCIVER